MKSLYNLRAGKHIYGHGGYCKQGSTSFSLPGHRHAHCILDFTVGAKHLKMDTE